MAIRSKTPRTPAKRSKTTSDPAATAPAKTKARRTGGSAKQPEAHAASVPEPSPAAPAELAVQEHIHEAPPDLAGQQAVGEASAGREDRASRALDAIKTLSEMIAEGIGTLAEMRGEMQKINGRLDQLAAVMPDTGQAGSSGPHRPEAAGTGLADDYPVGRDRDPGDAVPPGVAVMSPTPLTETDEAALQSLEDLPKRVGRQAKRGPRAKA